MSDNRKILMAKRKGGRNYSATAGASVINNKQDNNSFKRGIKRPVISTPKKNIANDRLKKLRTSLNEEVQSPLNQSQNRNILNKNETIASPSSARNIRKRPPNVNTQDKSVTKVPRSSVCNSQASFNSQSANDSTFNFKDEITQKSIFTLQNTTSHSLAASNSLTEEIMEWSSADNEGPSSAFNRTDSPTASSSEYFYIVVDTNIFLSQMQIIRNIIEMDVTGIKIPVLFIPWIVIEELDFIKDDSYKNSLKWKAQEAVKYIEKTLAAKNERMIGQTLEEASQQNDTGKGQDNKIISCCFQVLTKHQNMILLTDDINLRNKAHINHIPVCSHKEIMKEVSVTFSNQTKSQIILEKMTNLCNKVIRECALKAYGDACNKMPICQTIPKTIQDCIQIFTKYWFPVFQEVLMKQFKKSISDLSTFLTKNSVIKDQSKELNELLRLCVRVCIFLKDIEACKDLIENTIREMNNIKSS